MLLANQPVPRGNRVGIVTNAGGPGIMASDACESHGLEVPTLDRRHGRGAARVPAARGQHAEPGGHDRLGHARVVREGGAARARRSRTSTRCSCIYVPPIVTTPARGGAGDRARRRRGQGRRAAHAARPPKPVLSCFMGAHGVPEGLRSLQEGHIPSYAFPESAAIALARAVRYGALARRAARARRARFEDVDRGARRAALIAGARARAATGATRVARRPTRCASCSRPTASRMPRDRARRARADEAVRAAAARSATRSRSSWSPTRITHKSRRRRRGARRARRRPRCARRSRRIERAAAPRVGPARRDGGRHASSRWCARASRRSSA